jgi:hypothetical protein
MSKRLLKDKIFFVIFVYNFNLKKKKEKKIQPIRKINPITQKNAFQGCEISCRNVDRFIEKPEMTSPVAFVYSTFNWLFIWVTLRTLPYILNS